MRDRIVEVAFCLLDECGDFICWCSDLTENQIDTCLYEHPEWRLSLSELN